MAEDEELHEGKNEIINGIEINTMAIQSPAFMLQQKKSRKMGGHGAEETKINFFEGQFDMEQEKPEED
jgi:hypothetical protein